MEWAHTKDLCYSSPLLFPGNNFQDPQWMSETEGSTEPYIYCVFPIPTYYEVCKYNTAGENKNTKIRYKLVIRLANVL